MQAISLNPKVLTYNWSVQTGRPAKTERTAFGSRLHQAREEKGLSQGQVADQLGVPLKTYANWERRSVGIKPEHLNNLPAILNVTLDFLFGVEVKPQRQDGPKGKARKLFEEVNTLPRHQQKRVLATLEDALIAQKAKKA